VYVSPYLQKKVTFRSDQMSASHRLPLNSAKTPHYKQIRKHFQTPNRVMC
jgi:hypothetical protein